jgi:sialate O-acetylesterase
MSINLRFILLLFIATSANAAVRLPAIIGDNMVLQQGMKVRIWGSANAGEHVAVNFAKQTSNIIADAKGRWQVLLGPFKAGGPFELTVKGDNVLTIKNVLIGEVWLCSGQSNMEWPPINTTDGAETVAHANNSEIRLFTVEKHIAAAPLEDVEGHWSSRHRKRPRTSQPSVISSDVSFTSI